MGREHGGRSALPQPLELPRVGVEAVGVDQQRRRDSARHRPGELLGGLGAAEAGAERHGAGALGHLLHDLHPGRGVEAVCLGQPAGHLLEQAHVQRRLRRIGHRHLHVAGPGALRGAGGHRRRAGEAARAADHHQHTRDELRPRRRAARVEVEHALGDQPVPGARRAARNADLHDLDPPGVLLAGVDVEADLGAVEGGGDGGAYGLAFDLARARVDARGHVAGDHRRVLGVDRCDRGGERLARRAGEAGAQEGVDDGAGGLEFLRREGLRRGTREALEVGQGVALELVERPDAQHVHLVAVLAQQPRDHETIAAVVALAHDHAHRPGPRRGGGHTRQPLAGPLHQVERGHLPLLDRPGVDGAHLNSGKEGIEPIVGRHRRREVAEPTPRRARSRRGSPGCCC